MRKHKFYFICHHCGCFQYLEIFPERYPGFLLYYYILFLHSILVTEMCCAIYIAKFCSVPNSIFIPFLFGLWISKAQVLLFQIVVVMMSVAFAFDEPLSF